MYYRQKILLALLEAFGGKLRRADLQKYLFLFTEECQRDRSYEFVPCRHGCFSFQSCADKRKLTETGDLKPVEDWEIAGKDGYLAQVKAEDRESLFLLRDELENIGGERLVRRVYKRHPYYAINSETAKNSMNAEDLESIERETPSRTGYAFFTIGYEGKSFENYLNSLIKNNVRLLCDVRKNAFSRKFGFSKKVLSKTLEKIGIDYKHMPELGISSEKRRSLNSQADYRRIFRDYEVSCLEENRAALESLCALFKEYGRIAITCFEADPEMCHRNLVAKALTRRPDWRYKISHI